MAKKRYRYQILTRQSRGGRTALWMAGVSLVLFFLDALVSFVLRGNAGLFVGAVGLFAMMVAGYGFYLGLRSFSEPRVSHRLSVVGSISCGVIAVGWLAIFLVGV